MKKRILKIFIIALAVAAVLSVLAVSASAELWEVPMPVGRENTVLRAELNNGVMTLRIIGGNSHNRATLSEFTMAKIPWKSPTVYLTQNTGVFGEDIFGDCNNLKTINYFGSKQFWNKTEVGDYNDELKNINVVFNYSENADGTAGAVETGNASLIGTAVSNDSTNDAIYKTVIAALALAVVVLSVVLAKNKKKIA